MEFNNGILLSPLNSAEWGDKEKRLKNLPNTSFALTMPSYNPLKKDYIVFKTYDLKTYNLTDTGLKIMAQFNFVEFYQGLMPPALSNLFSNSMDSGGGKLKRVCSQKKGSDLSFQTVISPSFSFNYVIPRDWTLVEP